VKSKICFVKVGPKPWGKVSGKKFNVGLNYNEQIRRVMKSHDEGRTGGKGGLYTQLMLGGKCIASWGRSINKGDD